MAATYKDAGVDLDVYAESMSRLPRLMHRTFSPRVIPSDGGFAGLFRLDFDGKLFKRNYTDPVLVSGTDGVGTKLKIAQQTGRHDTVGIDLVAMCVNDLLCTGAEPLFFLDYVAMGRDDPARLEQIVQGISDGCVAGDMSLLGGETAIMPDMYGDEDYDLAGFAVGVVERKRLIDGKLIGEGDVVLGLAASGLHSNGFSLVRKIIGDAGLSWDDHARCLCRQVARRCLPRANTHLHIGDPQRPVALPGQASFARSRPHHRRRVRGESRSRLAQACRRGHRRRRLAAARRSTLGCKKPATSRPAK